jgi:hypothetical protein
MGGLGDLVRFRLYRALSRRCPSRAHPCPRHSLRVAVLCLVLPPSLLCGGVLEGKGCLGGEIFCSPYGVLVLPLATMLVCGAEQVQILECEQRYAVALAVVVGVVVLQLPRACAGDGRSAPVLGLPGDALVWVG